VFAEELVVRYFFFDLVRRQGLQLLFVLERLTGGVSLVEQLGVYGNVAVDNRNALKLKLQSEEHVDLLHHLVHHDDLGQKVFGLQPEPPLHD
jgi:hypothetical protein